MSSCHDISAEPHFSQRMLSSYWEMGADAASGGGKQPGVRGAKAQALASSWVSAPRISIRIYSRGLGQLDQRYLLDRSMRHPHRAGGQRRYSAAPPINTDFLEDGRVEDGSLVNNPDWPS